MVALRTDNLSWREIDGEMVVLDLKTSKYLTTNQAGTTLLKLLAENHSRAELTEALVTAFDIDTATAERDVAAFLDDLSSRGLLVGH